MPFILRVAFSFQNLLHGLEKQLTIYSIYMPCDEQVEDLLVGGSSDTMVKLSPFFQKAVQDQ